MTVQGIIERIDKMHPNSYDYEDKVKWVHDLDDKIYTELFLTHEDLCDIEFPEMYDGSNEVLVKETYDEIYFDYLERIMMRNQRDFAQMNNATALFDNAYLTYANYINRTYKPLPKVKTFNFKGKVVQRDALSTD